MAASTPVVAAFRARVQTQSFSVLSGYRAELRVWRSQVSPLVGSFYLFLECFRNNYARVHLAHENSKSTLPFGNENYS